MKLYKTGIILLIGTVALFFFGLSAQTQEKKVDRGMVLGTWELEVDAGGEYYYLTLVISETEGALGGTISDKYGMFTDVPLKDVQFDRESLTFEMTVPTPPDGLERIVITEMELEGDGLVGVMNVEELGVSAPVTGKRQK